LISANEDSLFWRKNWSNLPFFEKNRLFLKKKRQKVWWYQKKQYLCIAFDNNTGS